jgi:type III pantothenate kinase
MLLTIDIGNTLTDLGIFDGEKLISTYKTKSDPEKSYEEYQAIVALYIQAHHITVKDITGSILSSVVPSLARIWTKICTDVFLTKPLVVGPHLKTGLPIKADHPNEVGSDLVADAVGALHKYGPSCVIVDLGTANKVILLDKTGAFSGVAIAPGFKISIDALVEKTAALPEVSLTVPKSVIGKNTEDAMNSGMIYGTGFAVRGLAEAFEKEAGYPLKKILTGGNAPYVKDVLPDFTYDEWILLEGLRDIYVRNQK